MPRSAIATCTAAITLFCSAADGRAQSVTFNTQTFASSPGARGIASADFDRNGWADIAHANIDRNTVTILLSRAPASQSFTRAYDIPVGTSPYDLITADFNRDGIPDLAVANSDAESVSILLGRPAGGFSRTDIAAATGPRGLAAADFNEDGKVDLAVTAWDATGVQVYYGNGAGGFAGGAGAGDLSARPQGLAIADFNHDGHLDIVVAHASSAGLVLFSGTADGGLTTRRIGGEVNLNVVAAGDFNRDGWMDVAAASTTGDRVAVYLATGSTLRFARTYAVGGSPRGIVAADVNHDGTLDLATANRTAGTISLLLGNASSPGSFADAQDFAAGRGSRAIAAADFDRDGRVDLATGNEYAATASVLWNDTLFDRAGFSFKRQSLGTPSTTMGGSNQAWPADFNEDGRLDVVTEADYTLGRRLHVLITGGATVPLVYDHYLWGWAVADFNNDFHADVIIWQSEPFLTTVYLGDGRGGFTRGPATSGSQRLWDMGLGDVNQDGKVDLVFGGYEPVIASYIVQVMLGTGTGAFRTGARAVSANYVRPPRIADVNRDGKPDVVAVVFSSGLTTWFGDGTGALRAGGPPIAGHGSGGGHLALGDLNHDGIVDAASGNSEAVAVSLGTASGFASPTSIPTRHSSWSDLAIADVTMDGHPDIAGAPGFVIAGHGDGTFEEPAWLDFAGVGMHVADFTRDGLPDLITAATTGAVEVIVNERNSINHAPTVDAGADQTVEWGDQFLEYSPSVIASGADPDLHRLSLEWRDEAGNVLPSYEGWLDIRGFSHGTHTLTVTATDGRGGTASDSVDITIAPTKEIVLWAANGLYSGAWSEVDDAAAAGGSRGHDLNRGAPKVTTPSADPSSSMQLQFIADPTQTYKLWVRLKADNNYWGNDSVFVQFSGSADTAGNAAYRIGTSSGLRVNLEECSGCGISGWGWEDDGWGAVDLNGVLLRFPEGGHQNLVIQTREDGVSIDQVVLSSEKYVTTRPGAAKNDNTILRFTFWRDES
jgi:hypothetical protein